MTSEGTWPARQLPVFGQPGLPEQDGRASKSRRSAEQSTDQNVLSSLNRHNWCGFSRIEAFWLPVCGAAKVEAGKIPFLSQGSFGPELFGTGQGSMTFCELALMSGSDSPNGFGLRSGPTSTAFTLPRTSPVRHGPVRRATSRRPVELSVELLEQRCLLALTVADNVGTLSLTDGDVASVAIAGEMLQVTLTNDGDQRTYNESLSEFRTLVINDVETGDTQEKQELVRLVGLADSGLSVVLEGFRSPSPADLERDDQVILQGTTSLKSLLIEANTHLEADQGGSTTNVSIETVEAQTYAGTLTLGSNLEDLTLKAPLVALGGDLAGESSLISVEASTLQFDLNEEAALMMTAASPPTDGNWDLEVKWGESVTIETVDLTQLVINDHSGLPGSTDGSPAETVVLEGLNNESLNLQINGFQDEQDGNDRLTLRGALTLQSLNIDGKTTVQGSEPIQTAGQQVYQGAVEFQGIPNLRTTDEDAGISFGGPIDGQGGPLQLGTSQLVLTLDDGDRIAISEESEKLRVSRSGVSAILAGVSNLLIHDVQTDDSPQQETITLQELTKETLAVELRGFDKTDPQTDDDDLLTLSGTISLQSLMSDAKTLVQSAEVETEQDQTYQGLVTLEQTTTFTARNLTLGGSLADDPNGGSASRLILNVSETTRLEGQIGADGARLDRVETDQGQSPDEGSGTTVIAADVYATTQTYFEVVEVAGDSRLTGDDLSLNSQVQDDGDAGTNSHLTLDFAKTLMLGAIGQNNRPLTGLTVTGGGTTSISGDISTFSSDELLGNQEFRGNVQFDSAVTLSAGGTEPKSITFEGALSSPSGNPRINASEVVVVLTDHSELNVSQQSGGLLFEQGESTAVLREIQKLVIEDVATNESAASETVTLQGLFNDQLTVEVKGFDGTQPGQSDQSDSLTLSGTIALQSLSSDAKTLVRTAQVKTEKDQAYRGVATLHQTTTFTAEDLTFGGGVEDDQDDATDSGLILEVVGETLLGGPIGQSNRQLDSLRADRIQQGRNDQATIIAANIYAGTQTFVDAVKVAGDAILTANTLTFESTVRDDEDANTTSNLTLNVTEETRLKGPIGQEGARLDSLKTDQSPAAASGVTVITADIFADIQTFADAVQLADNVALTATMLTLESTVQDDGNTNTNSNLTLNVSGEARLEGTIGQDGARLDSVTTDQSPSGASGVTILEADLYAATQLFADAVQLADDVTFTATTLTFASTVQDDGNTNTNSNLTLNVSGEARLEGTIGQDGARLDSVNTDQAQSPDEGSGTTVIAADVYATTQTYFEVVEVAGDSRLTGDDLSLNSQVQDDGDAGTNSHLTLDFAKTLMLGAIGQNNRPLTGLTVTGGGMTSINGDISTFSSENGLGNQEFRGDVRFGSSVTLTALGSQPNTITFGGTIDRSTDPITINTDEVALALDSGVQVTLETDVDSQRGESLKVTRGTHSALFQGVQKLVVQDVEDGDSVMAERVTLNGLNDENLAVEVKGFADFGPPSLDPSDLLTLKGTITLKSLSSDAKTEFAGLAGSTVEVTTTKGQSYLREVELQRNATLSASQLRFASTVTEVGRSTTSNLVLNVSGETRFEGQLGTNARPLDSLETDQVDLTTGSENITVVGSSVYAVTQTFGDAVEIAGDATFDAVELTFRSTVADDGQAATPSNVTLDVSRKTCLEGAVGQDNRVLDSLTTTPGNKTVATNVTVVTANISATTQTFGDPLKLAGDVTFQGDTLTFQSTVDDEQTNEATDTTSSNLVLDVVDTARLQAGIGQIAALDSLSTTASGRTVIGANIRTAAKDGGSGNMSLNNQVEFSSNVTLDSDGNTTDPTGTITFAGGFSASAGEPNLDTQELIVGLVDSAGAALTSRKLQVNTPGLVTNLGLANVLDLIVSSAGGAETITLDQVDAANLSVQISGFSGGEAPVTISGTHTRLKSLSIEASSIWLTAVEDLLSTCPPQTLAQDGSLSVVTIGDIAVTTTGEQTYDGRLEFAPDVGNVTLTGPVIGFGGPVLHRCEDEPPHQIVLQADEMQSGELEVQFEVPEGAELLLNPQSSALNATWSWTSSVSTQFQTTNLTKLLVRDEDEAVDRSGGETAILDGFAIPELALSVEGFLDDVDDRNKDSITLRGLTNLKSLDVQAHTSIDTPRISTSSDQSYQGPVILSHQHSGDTEKEITFDAANLTFASTVDDDGQESTYSHLMLSVSGRTVFLAEVGGNHRLESLTTDAQTGSSNTSLQTPCDLEGHDASDPTEVTIIHKNINTFGRQRFHDDVQFCSAVTLSAANTDKMPILFGGTIAAQDLSQRILLDASQLELELSDQAHLHLSSAETDRQLQVRRSHQELTDDSPSAVLQVVDKVVIRDEPDSDGTQAERVILQDLHRPELAVEVLGFGESQDSDDQVTIVNSVDLAALSVEAPTEIQRPTIKTTDNGSASNAPTVKTSGDQHYLMDVTLLGPVELEAPQVLFAGSVTGVDDPQTLVLDTPSHQIINEKTIEVSNHGLRNGQPVRYEVVSGNALGELIHGGVYFVKRLSDKQFQLVPSQTAAVPDPEDAAAMAVSLNDNDNALTILPNGDLPSRHALVAVPDLAARVTENLQLGDQPDDVVTQLHGINVQGPTMVYSKMVMTQGPQTYQNKVNVLEDVEFLARSSLPVPSLLIEFQEGLSGDRATVTAEYPNAESGDPVNGVVKLHQDVIIQGLESLTVNADLTQGIPQIIAVENRLAINGDLFVSDDQTLFVANEVVLDQGVLRLWHGDDPISHPEEPTATELGKLSIAGSLTDPPGDQNQPMQALAGNLTLGMDFEIEFDLAPGESMLEADLIEVGGQLTLDRPTAKLVSEVEDVVTVFNDVPLITFGSLNRSPKPRIELLLENTQENSGTNEVVIAFQNGAARFQVIVGENSVDLVPLQVVLDEPSESVVEETTLPVFPVQRTIQVVSLQTVTASETFLPSGTRPGEHLAQYVIEVFVESDQEGKEGKFVKLFSSETGEDRQDEDGLPTLEAILKRIQKHLKELPPGIYRIQVTVQRPNPQSSNPTFKDTKTVDVTLTVSNRSQVVEAFETAESFWDLPREFCPEGSVPPVDQPTPLLPADPTQSPEVFTPTFSTPKSSTVDSQLDDSQQVSEGSFDLGQAAFGFVIVVGLLTLGQQGRRQSCLWPPMVEGSNPHPPSESGNNSLDRLMSEYARAPLERWW